MDETTSELRQAITDETHLGLLQAGYWASAAVDGMFSLFGAFYGVVGLGLGKMFDDMPVKPGQQGPPPFFKWMFVLVGACTFVFFVVNALLKARAAWCLKARRSRVYCLVIGALCCFSVPYGTILGVCTFLVLGRPSVSALLERAPRTKLGGTETPSTKAP